MTLPTLNEALDPLREQLLAAARELAGDAQLASVLDALASDVQRVLAEKLEIFPVMHHSPASAIHMVRRLRTSPPKVVFIEMCEDLLPLVAELPNCTPPVAFQAFAAEAPAFPERWAPLNLIAPLTPFSAEYQAMVFCLQSPEVELVFVDRSSDHVFQWSNAEDPDDGQDRSAPDEESARLHGGALGVELGAWLPTFPDFVECLLGHSRVSNFAEWHSLYVDEPTIGADYSTWRQVMVLVGSLVRRLGSKTQQIESNRQRERYMWTRMKAHLRERGLRPEQAIYICGAAHAASDVPEWGTAQFDGPADPRWDIPPRTNTEWQYGFIPSSFSAIEHQFGHPRGTISLAEQSWTKALSALGLKAFSPPKVVASDEDEAEAKPAKRKKAAAAPPEPEPTPGGLAGLMSRPPELLMEDHEQLLRWCTAIVSKARDNHYLASTADAIAIYQTSLLLARMRGRRQPSPYDFIDAAETCLDKGDATARRSVRQLCGMVLGGDRIGKVGYATLPPLVRDLYDRLAPLGVTPGKSTITRALIDFKGKTLNGAKVTLDLGLISDLLWRLRYLVPSSDVARPIMGERRLGVPRLQESWDIKLHGPALRDVIELSYAGVSVESVLELRIREGSHAITANAATVLGLAEDCLLYTHRERLTEEVGERAVALLTADNSAIHAREIFERVRRLVHHLRTRPEGLPHWLKDFVATGYQHYSALLPEAFADRGTSPEQLAGMLAFVFSLEGLALSLGCQRSQLVIAVRQAGPLTTDPGKFGLLWASELLLEIRSLDEIRGRFADLLANPMTLAALPPVLGSLLLALSFTPMVSGLAVEMLSRAFMELPDGILLPWLPGLLNALRPLAGDLLPALVKEVVALQPRKLAELDAWVPPWMEAPAPPQADAGPALSQEEAEVFALLRAQPAATEAWAARLGLPIHWEDPAAQAPAPAAASNEAPSEITAFIAQYGASAAAWAARLGS